MKILLLTKNYPPQIWWIEKYAYDLQSRLTLNWDYVYVIKSMPRIECLFNNQEGNYWIINASVRIIYLLSEIIRLSLFFFFSLVKGFFVAPKVDIIWSMDWSISIIWVILSAFWWVKTRVTIHGTDIVWNNSIYQFFIPRIISKNDEIYAISQNTYNECLKRSIPSNKLLLVPHTNQNISFHDIWDFDRVGFLKNLNINSPESKTILFSIGRWIERKGFHWFLDNILPFLDHNKFHYILAGFWPYEKKYFQIVKDKNISNVSIIGKISDPFVKAKLFMAADIFIMPNLLIEWNIEGQPIVLMEAKYYHLKSVIGHVQGAVSDKDTFFAWNDKELWINTIKKIDLWKK